LAVNKPTILFKTKGGHKEGMGDVTSSLAIAEEFEKQNFKVQFFINKNTSVVELLKKAGYEYHKILELSELNSLFGNELWDVVVLNQLNSDYEEALFFRRASKVLVTIEDTGQSAELADIRINVLYPIDESITDFSYIPLSGSYTRNKNVKKSSMNKVEKMLITQGGSDTYGFTPKIVKALSPISDSIEINVILGPNFSHMKELVKVLDENHGYFNLVMRESDLSHLISESDLAISAGGNTLFELACYGVPTIVVCGELFEVITADRLEREGFGINLGFGRNVAEESILMATKTLIQNHELRQSMSNKGKKLVDGEGIKRIFSIIRELYQKKKFIL
jgi:spore coat polysaccharide biosynthesis predicted glycosyltransferase SpsG